MISRLSYRARQFRRTLAPGITANDLHEAESALGGDLYALFAAMQPADQRHCLDVYRRLRSEGEDDPDLLAAALIHDAGKGGESARRIRTWHRVAYVILGTLPPGVLDRIARDYSVPFGDHSTLPVNLMVHASLPALVSAGTVFDGSGADAEFQHGIGGAKWKALYALPSWTRRLIGTSYRHARLWKLPPGSRLEAYIGQARISAGVPDLVARAILNCLNGIAYRLPNEVCASIDDNVVKYLVDTPSRLGYDMQHSVLELKHYCGGLYMPKSFDPLRNHGVRVAFPYTQPGVVHLACTLPSHIKCADNDVKGMLKRVAIESLPHQLVHLRKSGFKSPLAQFLALASTQERLHENVLGSQAPLSDYLYSAEVRKMIDRIGNGKPMAHSAK
ncbi:MAG: hypothetical protein IIB85_03300, partial [Chloroflexi bacterium]|nr:hypothetical protein [Chloroflexota bacterium]